MPKVYPSLLKMINSEETETEQGVVSVAEKMSAVSDQESEMNIFEKLVLMVEILKSFDEKSTKIEGVLNENEAFSKDVFSALKKMEGQEIYESDYLFARHTIDNNSAKIHQVLSNIPSKEELETMKYFTMEWQSLSAVVLSMIQNYLEKQEELVNLNVGINSLKKDIDDTETNDQMDESMFEGMFKLTGKQFKQILKNSVVESISGYILNVTDKNLTVQPYQEIELNNLNKIRPPVSVIKDETVLYIDTISFYNEQTGRAFDESDLETIVAFI